MLLILALNTIAKPIIVASIDEPPYDMIGSGDPTIGSNPVTIAMFMVTYKKIEKALKLYKKSSLYVAYNHRFEPNIIKLKKYLDKKKAL